MRGETLLFLPQGTGFRITDEFRQRTYGTIATEAAAPKPGRPGSQVFVLAIDLGGGMALHDRFATLDEAQERAEAYLRAHGALG